MAKVHFPAQTQPRAEPETRGPGEAPVGLADVRTLKNVDDRLSRLEGQIRGIRGMSAEGRACVDVVTQIAASRAGLKKVADVLVSEHIHRWARGASSATGEQAEKNLEELLRVLSQYDS